MNTPLHESKTKLLDAALRVIRAKGYTATRIEDVCAEAGVTKGSFFHHFKSKEDLALAAARHWGRVTSGVFALAPYRGLRTPRERLLGYVDFRKALLQGDPPQYTCLAGTMVQETYETHPQIREACEQVISGHAATLEGDFAEALRQCGRDPAAARGLALFTQAVIQGAFILAKAKYQSRVAEEVLDHLRQYLELLFERRPERPPAQFTQADGNMERREP